MLLCVFRGILQHFLFGVPPYNMLASGRWINFGTFHNFSHGNLLCGYSGDEIFVVSYAVS